MAATHKFPLDGSDLCFRGTNIQTVCSVHGQKALICLIWRNTCPVPACRVAKACPHADHACCSHLRKDIATYGNVLTTLWEFLLLKFYLLFVTYQFLFQYLFFRPILAALRGFWITALCCQLSFLHHLNKPLSVWACALCFTVTKAALGSKYNTYPLH